MKTFTLNTVIAAALLAMSSSVFSAYVRPGTVTAVKWYGGVCYATVSGNRTDMEIEGLSQSECETVKATLVGMNIDTITVK